ncbi:MAG: hypothetical protein ACRDRN_11795 [Sciscionella sp.]
MIQADPIPTAHNQLTDQQCHTLNALRKQLANAQDLGDLYTEWYAAKQLAAHLWREVGQYGADCCTARASPPTPTRPTAGEHPPAGPGTSRGPLVETSSIGIETSSIGIKAPDLRPVQPAAARASRSCLRLAPVSARVGHTSTGREPTPGREAVSPAEQAAQAQRCSCVKPVGDW